MTMNDWDIDMVEYISNRKKLHFGAFSSISSLYACLSKCYLKIWSDTPLWKQLTSVWKHGWIFTFQGLIYADVNNTE